MTEKRFRVFKFPDVNKFGVSDDIAEVTVAFCDKKWEADYLCDLLNDLTNEIKIARTVLDMNRGMLKEIQNENYQLKKLFLEMLKQTDVEMNPKKPTKYSATLIFDMEQYLTVRDIVKGIK